MCMPSEASPFVSGEIKDLCLNLPDRDQFIDAMIMRIWKGVK